MINFLRTFRAIFPKIAKYKKAPGPSTGSGTFVRGDNVR